MVQRAGRIDRLGSTFDTLTIYNMFPEKALEELLGHPPPEPGQIVAEDENGKIETLDFDDLPEEIKKQIEELKEQGFYDPDADFVGNWVDSKEGEFKEGDLNFPDKPIIPKKNGVFNA